MPEAQTLGQDTDESESDVTSFADKAILLYSDFRTKVKIRVNRGASAEFANRGQPIPHPDCTQTTLANRYGVHLSRSGTSSNRTTVGKGPQGTKLTLLYRGAGLNDPRVLPRNACANF